MCQIIFFDTVHYNPQISLSKKKYYDILDRPGGGVKWPDFMIVICVDAIAPFSVSSKFRFFAHLVSTASTCLEAKFCNENWARNGKMV